MKPDIRDMADQGDDFVDLERMKIFTTHKMTIKALCKELSCSQTWAREHIIKNLEKRDKLYIKPSHIKYIFDVSDKEHGWENVYLNEEAIRKYLYEHTTFTRQTINIPLEKFVKDPKDYIKFLRKHSEDPLNAIYSGRGVTQTGKEILNAAILGSYNRKEVPPVNVEFPYEKFTFENLLSLKKKNLLDQLKPYNGHRKSDEMYYRLLFSEGAIKATIRVPDQNGVVGTKIMYLWNNDNIESYYGIPFILIPYATWLEINAEQEKQEDID